MTDSESPKHRARAHVTLLGRRPGKVWGAWGVFFVLFFYFLLFYKVSVNTFVLPYGKVHRTRTLPSQPSLNTQSRSVHSRCSATTRTLGEAKNKPEFGD